MADYAIGDVQGCYEPLLRLLEYIDFDDKVDRLWFVGDLVNRGPESLKVLRFIHALAIPARITLGNHDLHLLGSMFANRPWKGKDDTIHDVLKAADGEFLGHWLRQQSILHYDPELSVVMCHAGIAPMWDLAKAQILAKELEDVLASDRYSLFLTYMYGNKPYCWADDLEGMERLRVITNYFTRMRYCDAQGCLNLDYKGTLQAKPVSLYPWYEVPGRLDIEPHLVFGHWAALMGACPLPRIHAIDTGCLWGGELTALRLQDKQRFSVWNKTK